MSNQRPVGFKNKFGRTVPYNPGLAKVAATFGLLPVFDEEELEANMSGPVKVTKAKAKAPAKVTKAAAEPKAE
ncbi:hypothetical protein [Bowmanella sp. JS7-9]|uniref:Uncharacterized protein n=1 Tax=Pseudobowmanella zhangzhouensis TaxID=1537679 RepID=A0ABW1XNY4_9ALTE|nr:hypothetical protein [Bowmanella sp. JS7-9]TBX21921.1 hypothetical protein TK45_10560 [Bowmanella sp. JS7-9]